MDSFAGFLNVCKNFIMTLTIFDILDMAIIAYLIYFVTKFLQKTNSTSVFKGIIALIAVMWLSNLLNLSVVSYLLGRAFEMGLIIVVILFQPEIRRLLEQFGGSNKVWRVLFGRKIPEKTTETAITQVALACREMSKDRVGALIVFERNTSLDVYVKTGTIIDAEPGNELLRNIFYPKSPLHDGAVIIRNGRLAGAACMLPLSANNNLSRDLGMRHRAGIGMSERSDAVVAIVSEETGAISVAVEGMLKRHLAPETFETLLRNELMPQESPKKNWIRKKSKKTQLGEGK